MAPLLATRAQGISAPESAAMLTQVGWSISVASTACRRIACFSGTYSTQALRGIRGASAASSLDALEDVALVSGQVPRVDRDAVIVLLTTRTHEPPAPLLRHAQGKPQTALHVSCAGCCTRTAVRGLQWTPSSQLSLVASTSCDASHWRDAASWV